MNLPNTITFSRIVAVPLIIWLLASAELSSVFGIKELVASTIFILASITDGIDGYLARRNNQVTTLGMLLDPLADKLLVCAVFIALVQFNSDMVPAWIAVIIVAREFLVSGLRTIAANEGYTIAASDLGKAKMTVQIVSVVACILDHRWFSWQFFPWTNPLTAPSEVVVPAGFSIFLPVHWIAVISIWVMVALSLYSAFDYFRAFWGQVQHGADPSRKQSFVLSRAPRATPPPPASSQASSQASSAKK